MLLIDVVYYDGVVQPAKKLEEQSEFSADALLLIEHVAEILAEEYITLLKKEDEDESSNLCPLLERESEGAKYR